MADSQDCEMMTDCPLFPLFGQSSFLAIWKLNYCHKNFHTCARYKLNVEGKPVPENLLPNGEVLSTAGRK